MGRIHINIKSKPREAEIQQEEVCEVGTPALKLGTGRTDEAELNILLQQESIAQKAGGMTAEEANAAMEALAETVADSDGDFAAAAPIPEQTDKAVSTQENVALQTAATDNSRLIDSTNAQATDKKSKPVNQTKAVKKNKKHVKQSENSTPWQRAVYEKGEPVLELSHLTKKYGSRTSVDDVSLTVYSGEVFGFLGPNGAGKTTTIRMITGLHSITRGEVTICGKSIKKDFKAAISQVGGIIENPEMYKYMSGWDNLKYYASMYPDITDEQIMDAVKLVRMQNRIREKVKRYSLGMRQRVGIAQSLLHNPRLLMLDEPTNGLDPAGIHEMRDFLKMLAHDYGIAVFISSHILSEMQLMCDRVGIVNHGQLIAVKTMEEWMSSAGSGVKATLLCDQPDKAQAVLQGSLQLDVQRNGNLLIFNTTKEILPSVSIVLAENKVSVLSLTQGEKTLEETFLELTANAGTEVL